MSLDKEILVFVGLLLIGVFGFFVITGHGKLEEKDKEIARLTQQLEDKKEMERAVFKRALAYHGVLFATYDKTDNTYRFIDKKGMPCRVFRGE